MSTKVTVGVIENLLLQLNGLTSLDFERIELLEQVVHSCNLAAAEGTPLVADAVYDTLVSWLGKWKPESPLLKDLWEPDGDITEYGEILKSHPMMSIQTEKSWTGKVYSDFVRSLGDGTVSVFYAAKLDGHGVRVVFKDGELVHATSRARASAGRDLTRQMRAIIGDSLPGLQGMGLVELRGEVVLPVSSLSRAREFNPEIKSAFTAVSSLIKPSSTTEENELLRFIPFRVLVVGDELFETKHDEYDFLENLGLEVPLNLTLEVDGGYRDKYKEIKETFESFEADFADYDYYCDGVVLEVDEKNFASKLGASNEKFNNFNIALKVGIWEQGLYRGIVEQILWTRGKTKQSPVAIVSEEGGLANVVGSGEEPTNMEDLGVLTSSGNKVTRVPLYTPRNILILEAYVGNPLHFRYGGEAGVVPCFSNGEPLTESAVQELLSGS